MKPTPQIHDPYHNPFHNRFRVPVQARLDEMQAYTHMVWLNERAVLGRDKNQRSRHWGRALACAFALVLVVIFSATLLSN
jgi:hypothetical protein